ncbi:MAG: hypothetical protein Q7U91_16315 [Sideroxyarcus sp.]|nr:hypothetical protein [Sideroxyarcus sp.]
MHPLRSFYDVFRIYQKKSTPVALAQGSKEYFAPPKYRARNLTALTQLGNMPKGIDLCLGRGGLSGFAQYENVAQGSKYGRFREKWLGMVSGSDYVRIITRCSEHWRLANESRAEKADGFGF